jgi:adenosine deaminase
LELRYTPYLRTPEHLSVQERIDQMAEIVEVVGSLVECRSINCDQPNFVHALAATVKLIRPLLTCAHREYVCAVDVAGVMVITQNAWKNLLGYMLMRDRKE